MPVVSCRRFVEGDHTSRSPGMSHLFVWFLNGVQNGPVHFNGFASTERVATAAIPLPQRNWDSGTGQEFA
jgi:hypothetical protein